MLVNLALRGIEPLRLLAWHLANDGAKIRNISKFLPLYFLP